MLAFASMERRFKKTPELSKRNALEATVQRNIRWPASLDEWLVAKADELGYRSPQEFVVSLVIEKRQLDHQSVAA